MLYTSMSSSVGAGVVSGCLCNCGRRADYELPRMQDRIRRHAPAVDQPETAKIAVVAFDSQVHAVEIFSRNQPSSAMSCKASLCSRG